MDERGVPRALWSVREVAAYLHVPAKTIYSWRSRGLGPPAFRLGRHLRFRPLEVEEWIAEHR
ncbi:MAG: helix-turn-helix transcriptional regulator, partial [Actinomycetota bacterium]